jgi:hypothetical protein
MLGHGQDQFLWQQSNSQPHGEALSHTDIVQRVCATLDLAAPKELIPFATRETSRNCRRNGRRNGRRAEGGGGAGAGRRRCTAWPAWPAEPRRSGRG